MLISVKVIKIQIMWVKITKKEMVPELRFIE